MRTKQRHNSTSRHVQNSSQLILSLLHIWTLTMLKEPIVFQPVVPLKMKENKKCEKGKKKKNSSTTLKHK